MLAALTTDEVLAIYPAERLPNSTERSLARRSRLLAELERVRQAGYAANFQESVIGLGAVAMAVLDRDGRPPAVVVGTVSQAQVQALGA